MYIKGFTYIGFALLFLWLGSLLTRSVEKEIDHVSIDHEEVVAMTSSYIENNKKNSFGFVLPGVFIMIPYDADEGKLERYECY